MAIRAPDGANNPIIIPFEKGTLPPAGKHFLLAQLAQPSLRVQALPCLLGIMMITVFVITLLEVLQNLNETLLDGIFGKLIYFDYSDNIGEVFPYHLDNPGRDHSFALALYALNCEALALSGGKSENT